MDDKKKKKEKCEPKAKKGRSLTGKPLDKIDTSPSLSAVSSQLPFESVGTTVVLTQNFLHEERLLEYLQNGITEADNVVVITHDLIVNEVLDFLKAINGVTVQFDNLYVMGSSSLSESATEALEVFEGVTLNEVVLTIQQRLKRKNLMKRIKSKIKRGRRIARKKFATKEKLSKRASRQARQLLRARLAGKQGADYKNLSLAARISVDKRLDKKTEAIRRIAKRLMPKVRKKEMERLSRARKSATNEAVLDKEQRDRMKQKHKQEKQRLAQRQEREKDSAMIRKIRSEEELFQVVERFLDDIHGMELDNHVVENLGKKAEQHDIHVDILKSVYLRGLDSYVSEETTLTKEQWAFNRVNSFVSGGAASKVDKDLYEKRSMLSQILPQVDTKLNLVRYKKQYQSAMQQFLDIVMDDPEKLKKGNTLGRIAQQYQNVSSRELFKLLKKHHPRLFEPVKAEEMTYEEYMKETNTLFLTVGNAKDRLIKETATKVLENIRSRNNKMKSFKSFNESIKSRDGYDVYHKDFSSAVQHAMKKVKDRGFEIDDDEWFSKVSSGPKKPGRDKTNSYNIELMKKGVPAKQRLHMQVYNKGGDNKPFELNFYVQ